MTLRSAGLFLAIAVPCLAVMESAVLAAETLTLEAAVALALDDNRPVRNAALEVAKAEDRLASYRTNRLPTVDLSVLGARTLSDIRFEFPAGAFGNFPGIGPVPAEDTDVVSPSGTKTFVIGQLAQPLTQLRRVGLGVRVQALNLEMARQDLRARRQSIAADVRSAYYSILQTQSALAASEDSVRFLKELERVVDNLVAQQSALPVDGLEVKARLAAEEYEALTLQNTLASRKEGLNNLMAREVGTEFNVVDRPEPVPFEGDLEAARARARERRADLAQARMRREQAELDRRSRKWDFVPDVSLTFSYVTSFDAEVLPQDFTSVGLYMSWEPFDWGRRARALSESRRAEEQAGNTVLEAENLAAIDVGTRFRALTEARALLDAGGLAREAARQRLNVTMERYRRNAALLKDVLESQEKLADAERRWQEALLQAWTARADFEKSLGEDA